LHLSSLTRRAPARLAAARFSAFERQEEQKKKWSIAASVHWIKITIEVIICRSGLSPAGMALPAPPAITAMIFFHDFLTPMGLKPFCSLLNRIPLPLVPVEAI